MGLLLSFAGVTQSPFNAFQKISLGSAYCATAGDTLQVCSGGIERLYRLTSGGLRTLGWRWPDGHRSWVDAGADDDMIGDGHVAGAVQGGADWDAGLKGPAIFLGMQGIVDDDSGFTSRHITLSCEFDYAEAGVRLRYTIWVYPGSGIRTLVELKATRDRGGTGAAGGGTELAFGRQQCEYLPISLRDAVIIAFGYYNDTERRNEDKTPILKEEKVSAPGSVDWASGLLVRSGDRGLVLVKESHKCVNQTGIATGGFRLTEKGITVTGLGMAPSDVVMDGYTKCWATWIVPYMGDSSAALLALKRFDRKRYPVRTIDQYMMANTWGSADGRYAARQPNILREISSQASLGIEVQQIDDGWQDKHWRPRAEGSIFTVGDTIHPVTYVGYPEGWRNVRHYAQQHSIQLALWAASNIPEKDMIWNYEQGGFSYYKLDGAYLNTKARLDALIGKTRSFILHTGHKVRVNWDVTEGSPRFGYFFAREYGNIFLENREPVSGSYAMITYRPYLVLRDAWQLSRYVNLNKFQVPVMNVHLVDNYMSDAYVHENTYAVAIALMSSPIFFEQTQTYSSEDRAAIKHLLAVYKFHRPEIFSGYVFPVGAVPNDAGWTGFQDVVGSGTGYLLLFRELHNGQADQRLRLLFLGNTTLELTDLLTGERSTVAVDAGGYAGFRMKKPADFRFYKYRVTGK